MKTQQWTWAGAALLVVTACAQPTRQDNSVTAPTAPPPMTDAPAPAAVAEAETRVREPMALSKVERLQSAAGAVADRRVYGMPLSMPAPLPPTDRERYAAFDDSGVLRVAETPVSTFSIDVDTGAYSNLRRFLREGRLPPQDAVRVEELINYFDYGYAPPPDRQHPFSVHTEVAPAPWNADTHLLRVGLQGWMPPGELPAANLVFLVDVSGSMHSRDKLPLVVSSLKLLVQQLRPDDRISLVTYAGNAGVVLEPTAGDQTATVNAALDRLQAGGGTNGASGIELAYAMARQGFVKDGINRVLLATDGDCNVGTVNFEQLTDLVAREREGGVGLSTLGFGTGNYNDQLMEQLADRGNGSYHYIDGLAEARRALVASRASTLYTIARDVKIQVEFNPAVVAEYRLIGYENRALNREDFANDRVDAGDIGAGHNVTALYEIALVGSGGERIAPLRYGRPAVVGGDRELGHLRLRYKQPGETRSRLIETPIARQQVQSSLAAASESFRFAAAVAAFGQQLRGGRYTGAFDTGAALALARGARGEDADGWRGEFVQLVQLAASLTPTRADAGQQGECGSDERCG